MSTRSYRHGRIVRFMIGRRRLLLSTLALCFVVASISSAEARCVCRCVNGDVQPICESSIDLPPICAPQICPHTPPSIAPIMPPTVPPIGTAGCEEKQVLNPYTGRYEWRRVCQ